MSSCFDFSDRGALGVVARVMVGIGLVAVFVLATAPALADAFDAALARAVAAKERALEVNDPARWEETLLRFQEADAIRTSRETRYEIGVAAQRLNQFDLAVEAYEAAIDMGLMGRAREKAEAFIARHASGMARVEVRGPAGTKLLISNLGRGTLPTRRPLVVFAGRIEVVAVLPGGARQVHTLTLRAGELEVLIIERDLPIEPGSGPVPALAPAPPSTTPSPGATVPSPAPPPPLLGAMPTTEVRGHSWRGAGVGLLSAGAVVAVGSAILFPVAKDRIDSARSSLAPLCAIPDGPDRCTEVIDPSVQSQAQSKVNTIETWKNVRTGAYVGLGVGGASVLVGTLLVATSRPNRAPRAMRVWVRPDAGGGRVEVRGAF